MSYDFATNIETVADDLDLPDEVVEDVFDLVEELLNRDRTKMFQPYGGFDAMIGFCIYAAARQTSFALPPKDLEEYFKDSDVFSVSSHFRESKIRNGYKEICRATGRDIDYKSLQDYEEQFSRNLSLGDECMDLFSEIIDTVEGDDLSRSPKALASGAVYLASSLAEDGDDRLTQKDISEAVGVSRPTLRAAKNDICSKLTSSNVESVNVEGPRFSKELLGLGGV